MKESCSPVDSSQLPWSQLNENISFKLLNGSREQGAHTLILRSQAREPNPSRGQFHPADEEFYCLGGDFTFDGSTWFKRNSYAFYPAHFVHGTNVHVRGGYELYLRIGGTNQILWEEAPRQNQPYLADGYESDDFAVQTEDALKQLAGPQHSIIPRNEDIKQANLHAHPDSGAGSTLVEVTAEETCLHFRSAALIEMFVLSGSFVTGGDEPLGTGHYLCDVAENASLSLRCTRAGMVLVSHGGNLHIQRMSTRI